MRASDRLERSALFVTCIAAAGIVVLLLAGQHLHQDGWLALVAGREVADHGIPQHDTLTAFTQGARWIDQQWLAQLTLYKLQTLGGLQLVALGYAVLAIGALALAVAAAHALGGAEKHILAVLPLAGFLYVVVAVEIRTQGFAYPLFVAVLWLLATDDRVPRRRTLLVFGALVLWANLHGSVILGVGLVGLYGLVSLVRIMRADRRLSRALLRPLAFCVGAPLCLLVTPYGIDGLQYYGDTILNPRFHEVITEWRPITSIWLLAAPFFVLAFGCVWTFARAKGTSAFEQLALLALTAAAINSVRNLVWFALALLILWPAIIGRAFPPGDPAPRNRSLNLAIAGTALVALLASAVYVAAQPRSWFERPYDQRTLAVVADATGRDPGLKVLADGRFADWLLWHQPRLAGRIAYDTRLELLTNRQLKQVANLSTVSGTSFSAAARGYGLLVLEPVGHPEMTKALLRQRGTQAIFRGDEVIVATRPDGRFRPRSSP